MNLKNNDNCTVDFDRLDDPEESKKLAHLFNLQVYRKNIMSTEDFEQYKRLFETSGDINAEELRSLSLEYMNRIDPYHPVYIVKDMSFSTVEELLKPDNVVLTLPAIYNKIGVVNNLGKDGVNIMQAFNNLAATDIDDRFDRKKQTYSKSLQTAINLMTDQNKLDTNKKQAQEMAAQALAQSGKAVQQNEDSGEELSEEIIRQYQGNNTPVNPGPEEVEEFL